MRQTTFGCGLEFILTDCLQKNMSKQRLVILTALGNNNMIHNLALLTSCRVF